jgi:Zn-dependent peptidase ImmA (M78 family)/DNA-binding XRE family transcriptional regulator
VTAIFESYSIAHRFNPDCLRVAREFRGLKKNELASRIDVTPSAITQFESGQLKPNTETLGRLSMTLRFPMQFLAHTGDWQSVSTDQCHFRSLRSASQIDRKRMIAGATILANIVRIIDKHVNLPLEDVSPCILTNEPTSEEDIERAAASLRRHWKLGDGPISNVVELLESKGLIIGRLLEECDNVDAFSFWLQGRAFIFLTNGKDSSSRSRFDAMHEVGHLLMHSDCLPGDKAQEIEAHRFASAFLLPADTFIRECPRRLVWPHFLELKKRWGVSLAALLRRASDLKLISADTYRRANVQLNQKGWKFDEPSEPLPEWPSLLPESIRVLAQRGETIGDIADSLSIPLTVCETLVYSDAPFTLPFTYSPSA